MKPISNVRIAVIILITALSIWKTIPTVMFYTHLQKQPVLTEPKPITNAVEPAEAKVEQHKAWEAENPAYVAWVKAHPDYVEWEKRSAELLADAIPLGLDLRGGVDVTLRIDEDKARVAAIDRTAVDIERKMKLDQISPTIVKTEGGAAMKVQVDPKDSQSASNTMNSFKGVIVGDFSAQALAAGSVFKLQEDSFLTQLGQDVEGAKKKIGERVDKMGVTQPKVTMQGNDRIRVQVPGEKDPDRLIANVISPANLQLKLVHAKNDEILREALTPEGEPDPAYIMPAGAELLKSLSAHFDATQNQMVYNSSYVVLNNRAELAGGDLARAYFDIEMNSPDGDPVKVVLEFKPQGAAKFAELTKANVGRQLAIVLDGVVRSHPNLNEPILDGRASITGGFTPEEAKDLSMVLKAGSLDAPLKVESKHTVGASLGAGSIQQGVNALLIGTAAVTIFMIVYYGMAGVIAVVALIMHILVITGIMALSKSTLTLSGIGGILLTVGMAVDANVLIYERVREELEAGRPLRQAIGIGYQRAFAVIFDSNVTTLLSALVLLQFTDGSVFGFALTMVFGLIANFYTGLTVTYTLCTLWYQWRGSLSLGKIHFPHSAIRFISMRKITWSLSTLLLIGSFGWIVTHGGIPYGVDFEGGVMAQVTLKKDSSADALREGLAAAGLKDIRVQAVTDQANSYVVETPSLGSAEGGASADDASYTETKIREALTTAFSADGYEVSSVTSFGSETSQKFVNMALWVVILASGSILIYLWFRFELVFGVAAVIALLHDLLIVTMLAIIWDTQITLEVVAALMVLMGFSVNDTIVIFDRIRENAPLMPHEDFEKVCDDSMNQSLPRTIITSLTVWITAICLFFVGGEGLSSFAKVLVLGVLVGTFSSDFLAAPLVYQWNKIKNGEVQRMLSTKKKKKRSEAQPIRSAGAATRPAAPTTRPATR